MAALNGDMQPYPNRAGNSGVIAYAIHADSICVRFVDGTDYLYTYRSAGRANVECMKRLARAGRGLSSFISRHVKDRYASKSLSSR